MAPLSPADNGLAHLARAAPDPNIRRSALLVMVLKGGEPAASALTHVAHHDGDAALRFLALGLLTKMSLGGGGAAPGGDVPEALGSPLADAVERMVKATQAALGPKERAVLVTGGQPHERAAVAAALARLGATARPCDPASPAAEPPGPPAQAAVHIAGEALGPADVACVKLAGAALGPGNVLVLGGGPAVAAQAEALGARAAPAGPSLDGALAPLLKAT